MKTPPRDRLEAARSVMASRWTARVLAAFVVVAAIVVTVLRFDASTGMDFYHYWAIPTARSLDQTLGNPYLQSRDYARVLKPHVETSADPSLVRAHWYRRELDLTGSPLFYLAFSFLPRPFGPTLRAFQLLALVSMLAGAFLLGRRSGQQGVFVVLLCLLLLYPAGPMQSEFGVGNVNAFQFLALVVWMLAARRRLAGDGVLLGSLVLLTLFKPNLGLVYGGMAWWLFATRSRGSMVRASLVGLSVAAGAAVAPCLGFRSWSIWGDWWRYIVADDPTRLFYTGAKNYSSAFALATGLGLRPWTGTAVQALFLATTLSAALVRGARQRGCGPGELFLAVSRDLRAVMCLGLAATIALSPVVWPHYLLLLFFPAFLFLAWEAGGRTLLWLGALTLLLCHDPLALVFAGKGWTRIEALGFMLSWLPVWLGMLWWVAIPGPELPATVRRSPA